MSTCDGFKQLFIHALIPIAGWGVCYVMKDERTASLLQVHHFPDAEMLTGCESHVEILNMLMYQDFIIIT